MLSAEGCTSGCRADGGQGSGESGKIEIYGAGERETIGISGGLSGDGLPRRLGGGPTPYYQTETVPPPRLGRPPRTPRRDQLDRAPDSSKVRDGDEAGSRRNGRESQSLRLIFTNATMQIDERRATGQ